MFVGFLNFKGKSPKPQFGAYYFCQETEVIQSGVGL